MAEAFTEVYMQSAVTCDTCENLAAHLCKTCHDKLCIRCKEIHRKSKSSCDHEITQLTFEALSQLDDVPSLQQCQSHPGCRINVCCKECQIPVCEKCLIGEHNGHKLTSTEELFHEKKKKLNKKYSFVESELPKYKSKLEKLQESEKNIDQSRDLMKNEIMSHFKEARQKLDIQENRLLQISESQHQVEHCRLHTQKALISENINKIQLFIKVFQNEISSERNTFILNANTSIGVTIPEHFLDFPNMSTLQFTKGTLDEDKCNQISGKISANTTDLCLMQEMLELSTIQVGTGSVESLAYQIHDDTFWVFLAGDDSFKNFSRSGEVLGEVKTQANKTHNKAICITIDGTVNYRKDVSCFARLNKNRQETMSLDLTPDRPICMCSQESTDVVIGIINLEKVEGKLCKFDKNGHRVNEMINDTFFKNCILRPNQTKIAETINGDICISDADANKVNVFDNIGNSRFSYNGEEKTTKSFQPRGICSDKMGNNLVADIGNKCIHVLDINGRLQALYYVSSSEKEEFDPITLAIDANHCLCVGCSDGKIRVYKYIE